MPMNLDCWWYHLQVASSTFGYCLGFQGSGHSRVQAPGTFAFWHPSPSHTVHRPCGVKFSVIQWGWGTGVGHTQESSSRYGLRGVPWFRWTGLAQLGEVLPAPLVLGLRLRSWRTLHRSQGGIMAWLGQFWVAGARPVAWGPSLEATGL